MRLRSLQRLIAIVKAMAQPTRVTVLGSSSLLAGNPELGEKGGPLELSLDADLLISPCDARQAGILHEAIGEGSLFHREHGAFVDVMKPDIVETLPAGWEERCVFLHRDRTVRCLNPIDLAVVKLQLGREKDVTILKSLIAAGIISMPALRKAYQGTPMTERVMFRAGRVLRQLEAGTQEEPDSPSARPPVVREQGAKCRTAVRRHTI